jgi:hypothetical protein
MLLMSRQPYHPLAAILVIVLDYLWTPVEIGFKVSGIGLIAVPLLIGILAVIALIGVFLVQKFVAYDPVGTAIAKAFVMAVLAAVPFPVMSTVIGGALLAWAGVSRFVAPRRKRVITG